MGAGKLISFEYIYKDGLLLDFPCADLLNSEFIIIKGVRKEIVLNRQRNLPVKMKALFITHKGSEYATMSINQEELVNMVNSCGGCIEDAFRLFEDLFEEEFE